MLRRWVLALGLLAVLCHCATPSDGEGEGEESSESDEEGNAEEGEADNAEAAAGSEGLNSSEFAFDDSKSLDAGDSTDNSSNANMFDNLEGGAELAAPPPAPAPPPPPPPPAPVAAAVAVAPTTAEANFRAFHEHYANVRGGHPEGVFVVRAYAAMVHSGPSERYNIVARLQRGDDVHVIKVLGAWAKIGAGKFVLLTQLRSLGLKTKGLEAYQASTPPGVLRP